MWRSDRNFDCWKESGGYLIPVTRARALPKAEHPTGPQGSHLKDHPANAEANHTMRADANRERVKDGLIDQESCSSRFGSEAPNPHDGSIGRPPIAIEPGVVKRIENGIASTGVGDQRSLPKPLRKNGLLVARQGLASAFRKWPKEWFDGILKITHPTVIAVGAAEHVRGQAEAVHRGPRIRTDGGIDDQARHAKSLGEPFRQYMFLGCRCAAAEEARAHFGEYRSEGDSPLRADEDPDRSRRDCAIGAELRLQPHAGGLEGAEDCC